MNPQSFPYPVSCALAALLLCVSYSVSAQEMASVRLDPAVQIKAIDGDKSREVLPYGPLIKRTAQLAPGPHTLTVCFDNSSTSSAGTFVFTNVSKCDADREVSVDAQAGHIYRLKFELLAGDWKTWIEDVTDEEARLVAQEGKPKNKGGGKSVILLRISPANGRVGMASGKVEQIWFVPGMFGVMPMKGNGIDGFISRKVSGGDSVATLVSWLPKNDSLMNTHSAAVCGETKIPVVEDVPGGGAFYLGEFNFTLAPEGQVLEVKRDGLEAAREFLRKEEPKLADNLQWATLRWMRVPFVCPPIPGGVLRIAPSSVSQAAASAAPTS